MAREFRLPELAESVVEGEIIRWLVDEGEVVADDQPLVEVMTDKVTVELPSPFAGVLLKQMAKEGDVVPVHQVLAVFADEGADAGDAAPATGTATGTDGGTDVGADVGAAADAAAGTGSGGAPGAGAVTTAAPAPAAQTASDGPRVSAGLQADEERSIVESGAAAAADDGSSLSLFTPGAPGSSEPFLRVRGPGQPTGEARGAAVRPAAAESVRGAYGRVLAVPAARRLARELDVELEQVEGSGPNGRIRMEDVRKHAERVAAGGGRSGVAAGRAAQGPGVREERVPVRGLRRAIATQMVASHLQAVRTLHVDEADATALVALRQRLKPLAEARGVRLSYLPFVMKAVTAALQDNPVVNASLDEEAGEIVRKHYYNLGMAVATDNGLVVPVIHDVDALTIMKLASEVNRLAAAARGGKLKPDEVKGGTFSITNIGSLGGLFSFPIINVPEAAILGVHSIKKRPVVLEDDSIVARHMLYLSLSFDHRLIDGAEASRFTTDIIRLIETPEALMLDL